jgi:hypothetical protein
MSKVHLKKIKIKRKAYNHKIDFKCFVQQKHTPFYGSTCSLDELDENQIIQKFQSLEILKERVARQMAHFKNHLIKKIMFNVV